jgi:murein DD-endopeptidase MepM/ murein hydrolase activator NlpD
MFEDFDALLYRLRYLVVGLLIVASLVFLAVILSPQATATESDMLDGSQASMYGGPNAVTGGLAVMGSRFESAVSSADTSVNDGLRSMRNGFSGAGTSMTSAAADTGQFIGTAAVSTGKFVGSTVRTTALFAVHGVASGASFVARTTSGIFGVITDNPVVNAAIKPSESTQVPIIDAASPPLLAANTLLPPVQIASQPPTRSDTTAQWPISGDITTLFGVPHWPYQPTHTGIDISDGTRSGITQVRPFKPGRVTSVVHSYSGLGNHVVVDHGDGMSSVYAHLYSIAAKEGQEVDKSTSLGLEGSTGASTGTHVHFEIRINGQPVNPLQYLNGRP